MTDKLNSSRLTPDNDADGLDRTWVPDSPANEHNADVGATFVGTPSSDDDDDVNQANSDKSSDAVDVNATFVPKSSQDIDEDCESEDSFGPTIAGTMPADDDEQEHAPDKNCSEVGQPVSNIGADATNMSSDQVPDVGATIVVGKSGESEPHAREQNDTEPFAPGLSAGKNSGVRSSGSGSGSKVSSQIWAKSQNSSLDELISIRVRSVSGTGLFMPTDDADFEIIEKLAEGGMGVVYIALQKSLNRRLAIKTLKNGSRSDSGTVGRSNSARALSRADRQKREMFLSEALVTANLVHPNIIPIHELAETDEGTPYYVMKQVHGIPWNKRIREMSLEENLDVMHKVCDAVAYAHHNGVINRDLKPENIMLGEFGEVLVLDWGLAVPAPHAAEQNFRSPVASYGAGTPAYMSPELWTGPPEAIGECSDIYLLGAILFEAITGKVPHDFPKLPPGGNRTDVWNTIDKVLRENQIRATDKSGELLDIALKALRTSPEERFGSVLEFQFSVRNYQRHEESRRLSSRATELIQAEHEDSLDYHTCQTAAALYEESLRTWAQNGVARTGLRTTRLQYARRAATKGDYDLGLQVAAQETDVEFVALSKKLSAAKRIRSSVKWAAITAMLCVVALGAKSIYDNGMITDLNTEVSVRKSEANKAIAAADSAKLAAVSATDDATKARANAQTAQDDQRQAETASRVAQVEIQSQSIRGLTLNQNYSDAIREIDRLLTGELLPQLPESIRNQRSIELQAQRDQLMKRARQSPEPIQTQAISPDRKRIAFGDAAGLLTVMQCPGASLAWESTELTQQQKQFNGDISGLRFVDPEKLVVASGAQLFLWNLPDDEPVELTGHRHAIQALDLNGRMLLSADESGRVVIRNLDNGQTISTLNLRTQLRDVTFLPGSNAFICAGSRGGESADIIAYRLSSTTVPNAPERLGQLRVSRQHNEPPQRISISPDGQLLAMSNSTNGNLVVLHAESPTEGSANQFPFEHPSDLESAGNMTWLVTEHERPVNDIQWSPDGKKCMTSSDDRTIRVWFRTDDANSTLSIKHVLRGHGARVTQAEFLDEAATQIASSSADRLSRLWDLKTLDEDRRQIQSAFHLAQSVPRAPRQKHAKRRIDGKYLLTAWRDESETVTDSAQSAGSDEAQPLNDVGNDQELAEEVVLNVHPRLHRGSVQTMRFSDNDQQLVTGATDGSIIIWDTNTAQPVASPVTSRQAAKEQFHEGHQSNIAEMSIVGPAGTLLATSGYDGSLRLWNMDPASLRIGIQQQVIAGLGLVNTFAASPNGEFLVTSAVRETVDPQPGQCSLWNLTDLLNSAKASPAAMLTGVHKSEVTAIAVSPDNRQIATGGRDGVIAVWETDSARPIASLRAHTKNTSVTALQWFPDGTLASSGLDGKLTQWRIDANSSDPESSGRLTRIQVFEREKTPIESMHLSPDGQQILTLSVETVRATQSSKHHLDVWFAVDPTSRHRVQLATVAGKPPVTVSSAEWSPDGKRVVVCVDGIVQIVDSQSWKITRVFSAGPGTCTDARLADQLSHITGNEFLVTFDGTAAHLWNLDNGEQLASFLGPFPVSSVAFLTAGDQQFVVSGGASLRIFDGRADRLTFGRPLFRTREGAAAQITSVNVCPTDPALFAAASVNGIVALWRWNSELQYAEVVRVLTHAGHPVSCCRWSSDGSLVLAIGLDGVLTICKADGSANEKLHVETLSAIRLFS
ncbi:MAG: protein kinase, partial [Planctomycetota bacterium]|nr:protein kinase [Planctomycetota bacterium]